MSTRVRLGDMLVGAGLIDERQLQEALTSQQDTGRRLGEELVHLGYISEVQVTQVLSNQLTTPWVSLYHVEFSRDLLNLVPAEMAEEAVLIPVYVRRVRSDGEVLFVAMDDPTNAELLERLQEVTGLAVKPMVAPPSEIKKAIQIYYFGGRAPAKASLAPTQTEPAPSRASLGPEGAAIGADVKPGLAPVVISETMGAAPEAEERGEAIVDEAGEVDVVDEPPADGDEAVASVVNEEGGLEPGGDTEQAGPVRSEAQGSAPRRGVGLTLTLLDGTTVTLPRRGDTPNERSGELTASDLIAALRARAAGEDVSHVLPDTQWEPLVAALLTLLIRKGLVADWELVEELDRHRPKPSGE